MNSVNWTACTWFKEWNTFVPPIHRQWPWLPDANRPQMPISQAQQHENNWDMLKKSVVLASRKRITVVKSLLCRLLKIPPTPFLDCSVELQAPVNIFSFEWMEVESGKRLAGTPYVWERGNRSKWFRLRPGSNKGGKKEEKAEIREKRKNVVMHRPDTEECIVWRVRSLISCV